MKQITMIAMFALAGIFFSAMNKQGEILNGAWQIQSDSSEQIMIFQDGYCTQTDYSKSYKEFRFTRGGRFSLHNDTLAIFTEFHSRKPDQVGQTALAKISFNDGALTVDWNGKKQQWVRIDRGGNPLTGCWRITSRLDGEKITEIPAANRKTLKLLSGTRFQWIAFNTETKEFNGTGGGTYTFSDGKYTENIEFFSRDSTRAGTAIIFDDKLENRIWHHTGTSSTGKPLKETWEKHQ